MDIDSSLPCWMLILGRRMFSASPYCFSCFRPWTLLWVLNINNLFVVNSSFFIARSPSLTNKWYSRPPGGINLWQHCCTDCTEHYLSKSVNSVYDYSLSSAESQRLQMWYDLKLHGVDDGRSPQKEFEFSAICSWLDFCFFKIWKQIKRVTNSVSGWLYWWIWSHFTQEETLQFGLARTCEFLGQKKVICEKDQIVSSANLKLVLIQSIEYEL